MKRRKGEARYNSDPQKGFLVYNWQIENEMRRGKQKLKMVEKYVIVKIHFLYLKYE